MKRGVPYHGEPYPVPAPGRIPDLTVDGFEVRFDPHTKQVAEARGVWRGRHVAVGRAWVFLSPAERMAVLLHEAGHLKHHHLVVRVLWIPLFWTRWAARMAARQELQADTHCAKQGYGDDLLRFVVRCTIGASVFYPGFNERVLNLQQRTKEYSDANLP